MASMNTFQARSYWFVATTAMWMAAVSSLNPPLLGKNLNAGQGGSAQADTVTARVDALFAPWNRLESPGCGLAVSQKGTLVVDRGYGMANLEHGIAITPASVFDVASISKQFTAMAILVLAQRGQLSLDDDVRTHIPELPDYGSRVTLRHLLTHTSGLRNGFRLIQLAGWRESDVPKNQDLLRIVARQTTINFLPGAEYLYNNSGYVLLATIVERVSGQSLRMFADANIFKPLGMAHTHVRDDPTAIVPNRVAGYYTDEGDGLTAIDPRRLRASRDELPGVTGSTGVYTTTSDLLRWEQNLAEVRVGDPALVALMQAPSVPRGLGDGTFYGFGLQVGQYRGLRWIGHGGSLRGFDLHVVRYPDHGLAIAMLCNLEDISAERMAQRVADIYLSDAVAPPARAATASSLRVSLPGEQLIAKTGLYYEPSTEGLRRVFVRDGRLMFGGPFVGVGANEGVELRPVDATRFWLPGDVVSLEFLSTPGGRQEMQLLRPGTSPLVFRPAVEFAPTSTELAAFAGTYASPELEVTYAVVARESALLLQRPNGITHTLRPTIADTFQDGRVGVTFTRDVRREITGFLLNLRTGAGWEVRHVRFDRLRQ